MRYACKSAVELNRLITKLQIPDSCRRYIQNDLTIFDEILWHGSIPIERIDDQIGSTAIVKNPVIQRSEQIRN